MRTDGQTKTPAPFGTGAPGGRTYQRSPAKVGSIQSGAMSEVTP